MYPEHVNALLLDRDESRRRRLAATLAANEALPITVTAHATTDTVPWAPKAPFDVVLLTLAPGENSVPTVETTASRIPDVPIITIDGATEETNSMALVRSGVQDHVPIQCARCPRGLRLVSSIRWAIERARLLGRIEQLRRVSAHRALHDQLTGLPNRELFGDRLSHLITQCRRRSSSFALMFADLDQFKQVNDSFGHDVGDQVIVEVGRRLRGCLRANDTCARWGGDEFTIALESVRNRRAAARVAERILRSFRKSVQVAGGKLTCRLSIGIALHPADGEDGETLTRHADIAMYRTKAAGGNGYCFYRDGTRPPHCQKYVNA